MRTRKYNNKNVRAVPYTLATEFIIQGVSGGIINILGGGSMVYSE
jgi:hypothetical protein